LRSTSHKPHAPPLMEHVVRHGMRSESVWMELFGW
jgi:hypothetical protein